MFFTKPWVQTNSLLHDWECADYQLYVVSPAANSVMWPTRTIHERKFVWLNEVIWLMKIKKNMYNAVCDIYLECFSKKSREAHLSGWYLPLQANHFSIVQSMNISFHVKCCSWYHGMALAQSWMDETLLCCGGETMNTESRTADMGFSSSLFLWLARLNLQILFFIIYGKG